MKNSLLVLALLSLFGCSFFSPKESPRAHYRVFCATAMGAEMISGEFSQVEILDGGAFLLVSPRGRRVIVNGYCLAAEVK